MFGGGGLTNEKAYLLGKFARVALRHLADRLQRPVLHVLGRRGRAYGRSGWTGACRSRSPTCDDADAVLLVGAQPGRDDAAVRAAPRRDAELIVVDPRRTPTAELATLHLQPAPGTDLALALGTPARGGRRRARCDKEYLAERTTGFDDGLADRRGVVAGAGRARHRGVRSPTSARPCACWPARQRLRADRRAAPSSTRSGTDTVGAWINLALALGLPGRAGSGYGCLTGQGNGQGGREHGQKADQLPGYRKIDDPAARAHVAAGVGRRRTVAGPGPFGLRAARRARQPDGPRRCWCSAATWSCPRRTPARVATGWRRWTCWWSRTSCCPRPPRWPTSCCRSRSGPRRTAR